jgi:hypothetical protein
MLAEMATEIEAIRLLPELPDDEMKTKQVNMLICFPEPQTWR